MRTPRLAATLSVWIVATAAAALPVIPGAQGFGIETAAGRFGTIYRVTNLNDSGPGSLREALEASEPRTVIFEISGTIELENKIVINDPYLTVAGQTAPSPGITIAHADIVVSTHDVLIQHLRIRVGDLPDGPNPESRDGIGAIGSSDGSVEVYNIVFDHLSVSWAIDENVSTWYENVHDVTLRLSIVSEALHDSLHPKGPHSKGFLIGDHSKNIAVIGNLFAHNDDRNPFAKGDVTAVVLNNMIYNADSRYIHTGDLEGSGPTDLSIAGNVLITGPDTGADATEIRVDSTASEGTRIYLADNEAPGRTDDPWSVTQVDVDFDPAVFAPPVRLDDVSLRGSDQIALRLLDHVGARPADRDAVDIRVVQDVIDGTGAIIDSQEEVGGWPLLEVNTVAHLVPDDPNGDDDGDGYTNLEEWLHEFAAVVEGRAD